MAAPIHLADFERLTTNPLKKGVINVFRRESMAMDLMPWINAGTLSVEFIRTKTAATPEWRKLNAEFTGGKATTEPVRERVRDIGQMVDVDKMLVYAKNQIINQRTYHTTSVVEAIAYEFNNQIYNGDPEADEDTIIGLWYRLINDWAAGLSIAGGSLDISSNSAAFAANALTFLHMLDQAIHGLHGHKANLIFVNDTLFLIIQHALRALGLLKTTEDSFDREIMKYKGAVIVDLGNTTPHGSTKVMTDTETSGTVKTGGALTSLICVRTGMPYFSGFYEYPLDVYDHGKTDGGVVFRTVIDWPIGLLSVNPASVSRVHSLTVA